MPGGGKKHSTSRVSAFFKQLSWIHMHHPKSWQEDDEDLAYAKALKESWKQWQKDEDEKDRHATEATIAVIILKSAVSVPDQGS